MAFLLTRFCSQDTNTMQYELMKAIGVRRCVTIVGDPDQSSQLYLNSSPHQLKTFYFSIWLALRRNYQLGQDARRFNI
jgi:hypothetical protein